MKKLTKKKEKPMINKWELSRHMAANHDTQKTLAAAIGISLTRLSAKINGWKDADFKRKEIAAIKVRYGLSADEVDAIFFQG